MSLKRTDMVLVVFCCVWTLSVIAARTDRDGLILNVAHLLLFFMITTEFNRAAAKNGGRG